MKKKSESTSLKGELLSKIIRSNKQVFSNDKLELPESLSLLPLIDRPFFPSQTLPLIMNENYWLEEIKQINKTKYKLGGLILSMQPNLKDMRPQTFCLTGALVRIHHPVRAANKVQFIAEGLRRFQIKNWISTKTPFFAEVNYPEILTDDKISAYYKAYAINIINTLKEMKAYNPLYNEELKYFLNRFTPNEPSELTDFAASLISSNKEELQSILDTCELKERMDKVLLLAKKELEVVKIQAQIRQDVEAKMSQHQRKFFLREQLKSIQKELGITKDDKTADIELLEQKISNLKLEEKAKEKIANEMQKLSILEIGSPEYSITRNYLETVTNLPWGVYSKDTFDLKHARKILDNEHEGLEEIKKRILEFIAVGQRKGNIAGSIILLVGPPGVGKTSIAKSIAAAINRNFYRFSLGGMRDEAEIKGHRRTYIGAMPGKFINALKEAGTANPVILLDEIDKIGSSFQGDPASSLLEVLDPEQNYAFLDNYIDIRFDISKAIFICTANQIDTIPKPLLDRMEIIRLSGYITEEKVAIAKKHLWPKIMSTHGINKQEISLPEGVIKKLIENYAREAGVRHTEQLLAKIARKSAYELIENPNKKIKITANSLKNFLGYPRFKKDSMQHGVGLVTGLAWTALGGATIDIEATCVHQKSSHLKLTGKLGSVMQESAEIAYSFLIANLKKYGILEDFFDKRFIHIHFPEGAIPKDGPSAGITIASSLLSLAKNKAPIKNVAMTGELTLTGRVLAVGGIREKIVAAKRNGIKTVILPKDCINDYNVLPDYVKSGLKAHFVTSFDETVEIIFP